MTRYKRYLKEVKELHFDEDLPYLPYNVDSHIVLEGRDVYATPYGLLVVAVYNVCIGRSFYLSNGKRIDVYDEDDDIKLICETYDLPYKKPAVICILDDFPNYRFMFDDDDNLIAVQYGKVLDLFGNDDI